MATLIGGRDITDGQQAYASGSQYRGPSVAPTVNQAGLGALANALGNTGAVGQAYLATRVGEEAERQKFATMEKWSKFQGEYARRMEAAKTSMPADGAGYLDVADKEFQTGFNIFMKDVPPLLKPEFTAMGENFRQDSLLRADNYTRGQTRAHAEFVVKDTIDSAKKQVYVDPSSDPTNSVAVTIANAPGLTATEKEVLAESALHEVAGARFGGKMRDATTALYATPYSKDVSRRIMPALIGAESSGNPEAESSAGAIGLTQVMPGTAAFIAQALQDYNFPPPSAGVGARREYMQRPEVSKLYGEFYFNMQLKEFGGDVQLALVAYNAGPENARKFRDAGRNWNVLPMPEQTKPYVEKITRAIGGLTPEMAFDPENGLNFEQALGASGEIDAIARQSQQDAATTIELQKKEAQARQDQLLNSLYMRAETGEDFTAMYAQEMRGGQLQYDQAEFTTGRGITARVNKDRIDTGEAFTALQNGTTMTADQGDRVMTPELRQGMLAKDPQAIGAAINRIDAMGFVPPNTQKTFSQMLYSPDLKQVSAASQAIFALQQRNPQLVANLPDDMVVRAETFEHLRESGTPENEITDLLASTATKEQRASLAAMQKQDPDYEDNKYLPPDELANSLDSYLPFTGDTVGTLDSNAASLLQLQYTPVYDAYYARTRNADTAKALATKHILKQWGATRTGGQQRLAWLPPEQLLTNFNYDLNKDGKPVTIKQPADMVRNDFDLAVRQKYGVDNYIIRATPDTLGAAQTGKPIPYVIIPVNSEGQPNYNQPNFLQLMTEPFFYDYGKVAETRVNLLQQREAIQTQLDELENSKAANDRPLSANVDIVRLRTELEKIGKDLGE